MPYFAIQCCEENHAKLTYASGPVGAMQIAKVMFPFCPRFRIFDIEENAQRLAKDCLSKPAGFTVGDMAREEMKLFTDDTVYRVTIFNGSMIRLRTPEGGTHSIPMVQAQ